MANRGYQSSARVAGDVKYWNEEHPVGTRVIVDGKHESKTVSAAYVHNGFAVIELDVMSGGYYALNRVRPA